MAKEVMKEFKQHGSTVHLPTILGATTEDTYCLVSMKILRIEPSQPQKFSVDGHFIYPGTLVIHVPPKKR